MTFKAGDWVRRKGVMATVLLWPVIVGAVVVLVWRWTQAGGGE